MATGHIIPSLLQQFEQERRQDMSAFVGFGRNGNRNYVPIGRGLVVDQAGRVIQTPRQDMPSQMEGEDMVDKLVRFLEFERGNVRHPQHQQRAVRAGLLSPQPLQVRATDPMLLPQPYFGPADFTTEFGTPVDPQEIISLCEEISMWSALPEVVNGSVTESWREMNELNFTGGQNYVAFAEGACPEEYEHGTVNKTLSKKHIGAKKTLSQSQIVHSIASIAAGFGVSQLVGPIGGNETGGMESPQTFTRAAIGDAKEKEIRAMMTLILNGWDELLVTGDQVGNSLEFDGIEKLVTSGNGARINFDKANYSGSFNATRFDEWLATGCVKPDSLFGHPTALQALKLGYWGLGAITQGGPAQLYTTGDNGAIKAGLTFTDAIQTSVGTLRTVGDTRFTRTDLNNGSFSSNVYAMRMQQNGVPLVYKATQIPLAFKDLAPGCSAISFLVMAVTALVIKHMCAHGVYRAAYTGLAGNDGCYYVHPTTNP